MESTMARPREFDENEVLDQALDVFWRQGFDATSVEDLVQATGLGRASLYGAFGDKEQLFKRALDHYLARASREEEALLDDTVSARDKLRALFATRIPGVCSKSGPRGCFLLLAGTSGGSPEIAREALALASAKTHKILTAILRQAEAQGELAKGADPEALARFIDVLLNGLATSGRAGMSARDLATVSDQALEHVFPNAQSRARSPARGLRS